MIWYKDADNRVLRCNRAAAEWYGKPQSAIEGRSAYELFPARAEKYRFDDLAVIKSGKARRGLIEECVSPLGKRSWVRRDILPRVNKHGKTIGVIIFAVDITAIKRAEHSLRDSERSQRDFVANVSHEFRTPVAAIKGFAETLRRGAIDDKRSRLGFVRTIESHADRLDWLVHDLLELSRLGSGMVSFAFEKLSAREFLSSFADGVAPILERRELRLAVDAAKGLRMSADRPHLVQVFDNLLSNAFRYSPKGGVIRLEARPDGRRCRLTVRDQGPGIAPEHLPRLFDRFYRVEKGDGGGNSGLGLHIVKTIVEGQGGKVWAESAPGKGAAFHVSLPRG
jgi:two-component system phosphate regulon sensor histidine kinase PhoR